MSNASEEESLNQWLVEYGKGFKRLKQNESAVFLKSKLESLMLSALSDVKNGFNHPSKNFIEKILIPGDPSTDEILSLIIEKAKDKSGVVVKKNKELLKILDQPFFKIKTSFLKLEQQPYVKAFLYALINNLWNEAFRLSDMDQHQAEYNISFLRRLKARLLIADDLIDPLIKLNQFAGARRKGLRPPTTFAFIESMKTAVTDLSSQSFTRHLDINILTLKLLFPDLLKGVSRSAIAQKRWRKSKIVKNSD